MNNKAKRLYVIRAIVCVGGALLLVSLMTVLLLAARRQHTVPQGTTPEELTATTGTASLASATPDDVTIENWLAIPGTDIDAAVMQAEDNNYYLRRNEAGEDDIWGCYYFDFACSANSQNLIVYGHSVNDSPDAGKFSQLKRFSLPDFAADCQPIGLTVDGAQRQYTVFSAGKCNVTDTLPLTVNPSTDEWQLLVADALKRSDYDFGEIPPDGVNLLTLITCTSNDAVRYVVMAFQQSA